jgi:hypothetical protein
MGDEAGGAPKGGKDTRYDELQLHVVPGLKIKEEQFQKLIVDSK